MAFFEDANANVFVGVRWYEPAHEGDNFIDPIVRLAKLKLSPVNNTRSYACALSENRGDRCEIEITTSLTMFAAVKQVYFL